MVREGVKPGYVHVSDVSGAFAGYSKVPKNVLDYAADRGTHCHALIYDIINDIPIKDERWKFCDKSVRPYIECWQRYWDGLNVDYNEMQEERIYNDKLMLTGQVDLICNIKGKRILIDWKCTAAASPSWKLQAGGYFELLSGIEMSIDRAFFVRLDKDGKDAEVVEYRNDYETYDLFMSAFDLYKRFLKEQTFNLEMD